MAAGRDSYVTLTEALGFIRELLPSADPARLSFEALTPEDQTVFLRRAMSPLEGLYYAGRKTNPAHPLQFPRDGAKTVPKAIKRAQALEACALSYSGAEAAKRATLQAQGVKSFNVGSLSESYETSGRKPTLLSQDAQRLVEPYLLGVAAFA